ncbi:MAG TPA: hypothetical protein VGK59_16340, partial [Ohtaekwangia sp.]
EIAIRVVYTLLLVQSQFLDTFQNRRPFAFQEKTICVTSAISNLPCVAGTWPACLFIPSCKSEVHPV